MTLAANEFVSAMPYTIVDGSGHAHSVTLPLGVTFDGGFSTATFNGVKGSAIVLTVVSDKRVHVQSTFGVTLS